MSELRKRTILFIAADPGADERARWDQEFRDIHAAMERARNREAFTLEDLWAAGISELRRGMLDKQPSILHISGKNSTGGINFCSHAGQNPSVSPSALTGFLEMFKGELEWVILSGSYTEVQAQAISEAIPNVIGLEYNLTPAQRIEGVVALYDYLGAKNDGDAGFATKLAAASVSMAGGNREWVHLYQGGKKIDLTSHSEPTKISDPVSLPDMSDFIGHSKAYYCNRTQQDFEFAQRLGDRHKFHFYVLHGNDPQSHHGLFHRFYEEYLSQTKTGTKALRHKINLRESSNIDHYKIGIASKLLKTLNLPRLMRSPLEKQMTLISDEMVSQHVETVAIEFRVRSSHWKSFTPELLKWFVEDYCRVDAGQSSSDFYFFLSIIYEKKSDHEILVEEIKKLLPSLEGVVILSELLPVEKADIEEWLDEHITSNSVRKMYLMHKYFPEDRNTYDMAEVELRLDKIIENEPKDN